MVGREDDECRLFCVCLRFLFTLWFCVFVITDALCWNFSPVSQNLMVSCFSLMTTDASVLKLFLSLKTWWTLVLTDGFKNFFFFSWLLLVSIPLYPLQQMLYLILSLSFSDISQEQILYGLSPTAFLLCYYHQNCFLTFFTLSENML